MEGGCVGMNETENVIVGSLTVTSILSGTPRRANPWGRSKDSGYQGPGKVVVAAGHGEGV